MTFLLDANAVIALLKANRGLVSEITQRDPNDFGLSSIVLHKLFFGVFRSRRIEDNLRQIDALQFTIIDFDREDARSAGKVRASLAKAGTPIGPYDVLIAGQALARDLAVITNNTREFSRVPGLRIEDWQS